MDILNIKCIPRRTSLDVSSPSMYTVTILNTEKRDWGEGSSHAGRVVFVQNSLAELSWIFLWED